MYKMFIISQNGSTKRKLKAFAHEHACDEDANRANSNKYTMRWEIRERE